MSLKALRMAEKAMVRPSGEKLGDSGSSSVVIAIRSSIFVVSTFWMMSVRSFSILRSRRGDPFGRTGTASCLALAKA